MIRTNTNDATASPRPKRSKKEKNHFSWLHLHAILDQSQLQSTKYISNGQEVVPTFSDYLKASSQEILKHPQTHHFPGAQLASQPLNILSISFPCHPMWVQTRSHLRLPKSRESLLVQSSTVQFPRDDKEKTIVLRSTCMATSKKSNSFIWCNLQWFEIG